MRQRYFYQASTGRWCAAAFGSAGEFSTSGESHAADVAASLGIPATDIDVVEVDGGPDPRTGSLLSPPPVPETPDAAELRALDVLLARVDGTLTAADVRTLVLMLARRLRRRGAL